MRILQECLVPQGGYVLEIDAAVIDPSNVCQQVLDYRATALLLLVGHPEPAMTIVRLIRSDSRLGHVMLGAPAGQPELSEWARELGEQGAGIPFLRYLPAILSPTGARVESALCKALNECPSFVAFEGYDTIIVLASLLTSCGTDRTRIAASWPSVDVEGTRGRIQFARTSGVSVWQWVWPPVQVCDRDPESPDHLRVRA